MFDILGLQEIIASSALEHFQPQLDNFKSLNEDVEYFIRHKAVDFENRSFCRTFLVINNTDIIAYFTIGLKNLSFKDYVSNNRKKAIHGISSDVSNVPVILIGQLSKNANYDNLITGEKLLSFAVDMIRQARNIVGGRVCLVETPADEANSKVIEFYEKCGFVKLQTDDNGTMQQMYLKIK